MSERGRRRPNRRVRPKNRWISLYESILKRKYIIVCPKPDPISNQEEPTIDPDVINVTNVDLDIPNNTEKHHTDEFEITDMLDVDMREFLVIRRGQKFNINIEFDRKFNKKKDDLHLVFKFGSNPKPSEGTHADLIVSEKDNTNDWGAHIESVDANGISLTVMTPPTCPVGIWRMSFDVVKRGDDEKTSVFRYSHTKPIYILFNPWCEDDQVFMHETTLLNEYVLNESGRIYTGSYKSIGHKKWNFGQFSGDVLDCILYLLDESTLMDTARGDPVRVSRKLSNVINSADDIGVLTGNWTGDYTGGTSPLAWKGSVAILNEYYKSKEPVCYGQCWVFSGVLTTACRALGIPARSVTNFCSAHDTDGSTTIDIFFNSDMEPIEYLNDDSVWNFHVWNDVWMARPDITSGGYGGWQAIDATPQETSEGCYRMGPMSLEAIKHGEVTLPYDGKFVLAEVNGDRVYWKKTEDGDFSVLSIQKYAIGKNISTKEPFTIFREDITNQYKYPEGSVEERAAVRRAYKAVDDKKKLYESTSDDVTFELITDEDQRLGDTIRIILKMKNNSTEERSIDGTIKLDSMYYTGTVHACILKKKLNWAILQPYEEKIDEYKVDVDDYLNCMMDHNICKITCSGLVMETKQTFFEIDDFLLVKPKLEIKAPKEGTVGEKFKVEVSFKNPLPLPLTKCKLVVEGGHLQKPTTYKQENVKVLEKFTGEFEITPKKAGKREFIVSFNCRQIDDIDESHEIQIKKKK